MGRRFAALLFKNKDTGCKPEQRKQGKGNPMKIKSLMIANKSILIILILGLALAVLTGCGIGHGPYRHAYDGNPHYRSGYGYHDTASNGPTYDSAMYDSEGRGYARPANGYGGHRGGYCGW
jgi:hypothetical protein